MMLMSLVLLSMVVPSQTCLPSTETVKKWVTVQWESVVPRPKVPDGPGMRAIVPRVAITGGAYASPEGSPYPDSPWWFGGDRYMVRVTLVWDLPAALDSRERLAWSRLRQSWARGLEARISKAMVVYSRCAQVLKSCRTGVPCVWELDGLTGGRMGAWIRARSRASSHTRSHPKGNIYRTGASPKTQEE